MKLLIIFIGSLCLAVNGSLFSSLKDKLKKIGYFDDKENALEQDMDSDSALELDMDSDSSLLELDSALHSALKRQATDEFRQRALQLHNEYRARHGSPPLVLDDKLNAEAQAYAMVESKKNVQKHSCGPCDKYGENLAYNGGTAPALRDGAAAEWACKKWYEEISLYNFQKPNIGKSHKWGHFSALVWKASRKMGIGIAYGTKLSRKGNKLNTMYVVARYLPPGNVFTQEEMKKNVPPLQY